MSPNKGFTYKVFVNISGSFRLICQNVFKMWSNSLFGKDLDPKSHNAKKISIICNCKYGNYRWNIAAIQ